MSDPLPRPIIIRILICSDKKDENTVNCVLIARYCADTGLCILSLCSSRSEKWKFSYFRPLNQYRRWPGTKGYIVLEILSSAWNRTIRGEFQFVGGAYQNDFCRGWLPPGNISSSRWFSKSDHCSQNHLIRDWIRLFIGDQSRWKPSSDWNRQNCFKKWSSIVGTKIYPKLHLPAFDDFQKRKNTLVWTQLRHFR